MNLAINSHLHFALHVKWVQFLGCAQLYCDFDYCGRL